MVRPLVILALLTRVSVAQPSATPATVPENTEVAVAVHGGATAFACLCEDSGEVAWGPFVEVAITKRFSKTSVGLFASGAYFPRFSHLNDDERTYRYSHAELVHTGGRIALGGTDGGFDVGIGLGLVGAADDDPRSHGGVLPSIEAFANIIVDRFGSYGTSLFGALDVTPSGDGAVVSLRFGLGFESY